MSRSYPIWLTYNDDNDFCTSGTLEGGGFHYKRHSEMAFNLGFVVLVDFF